MAAPAMLPGFFDLSDRSGELLTTIGVPELDARVALTVAEWQAQRDAMETLFCSPTTAHSERFKSIASGMAPKMDPGSQPDPVKFLGFHDAAYPIYYPKQRIGANFVTRQKMTIFEFDRQLSGLLSTFNMRMIKEIIARIVTPTELTFTDQDFGDLTIKGLANAAGGDTDQFLILNGAAAPSTDTHYIAQAAAVADGTNPYAAIHKELMEHPENDGSEVVCFVGATVAALTEVLLTFVPLNDAAVRPASDERVLIGSYTGPLPGSAKVIGRQNRCWIVQWDQVPTDYIIAIATAGERPLRKRLHVETSLQGLVKDLEKSNEYDMTFIDSWGLGARNKVGAAVWFTNAGDTTYDIPANYTAPLP